MNINSFSHEKSRVIIYCIFLSSIQNKLSEMISNGVIILECCAVFRKY